MELRYKVKFEKYDKAFFKLIFNLYNIAKQNF